MERTGGGIVFVITVIVLAALLYIGTRGQAGVWVRDTMASLQSTLFPPQETSTPLPTEDAQATLSEVHPTPLPTATPIPTPVQTQNTITEMVEVPGILLYAIQVGAFKDETNAQLAALQDEATGGAGFVWKAGEYYRVFHVGFKDNAQATAFRTKMQEEKRDVGLYPMEAPGMKLEITSTKERVQDVQDAFAQWETALQRMETAPNATLIKEAIETLRIDMGLMVERMEAGLPQDNRNGIYQGLLDLYKECDTILEQVLRHADDKEALKSAIRKGYFEMVQLYRQYVDEIIVAPTAP